MALHPLLARGLGLWFKIAAVLSFLPPLLARLLVAHSFYLSGNGKLEHPDRVVQFFTSLGIPMPGLHAAFVSRLEYYGAFLILAGLATRPVAALLGGTMVVALLTADRQSFLDALLARSDGDLTTVAPVPLGICLAWLLVYGPGLLSLDALLARVLGIPRTEAELEEKKDGLRS